MTYNKEVEKYNEEVDIENQLWETFIKVQEQTLDAQKKIITQIRELREARKNDWFTTHRQPHWAV